MTAPTTSPELVRYLLRVSDALADLDASDRDDLLEDLRGHLEELAVENPDVDFEDRLGSAESYAAELRAAAGLPAAQGISLGIRFAALTDRLRELPLGREVLAFLPELRPAWWVLRAWGVIALLDVLLHRGNDYRFLRSALPAVHGSSLLGLILLGALIVGSVRIGQRSPRGALRLGVVVINAVLALAVINAVGDLSRIQFSSNNDYSYTPPGPSLVNSDGSVITNIYPYDAYGNPLQHVQLFDENGNPINITDQTGTEHDVLHNVFPQSQVVEGDVDENGNPIATPIPAPSIAAPAVPLPAKPKASLTPHPPPS